VVVFRQLEAGQELETRRVVDQVMGWTDKDDAHGAVRSPRQGLCRLSATPGTSYDQQMALGEHDARRAGWSRFALDDLLDLFSDDAWSRPRNSAVEIGWLRSVGAALMVLNVPLGTAVADKDIQVACAPRTGPVVAPRAARVAFSQASRDKGPPGRQG